MMPMASTCSAAISAACHRPAGDSDAHLVPIEWGEVSRDEISGVGHCSFTTSSYVERPTEGYMYK
jgi:hypothetical protein